MESDEIIINLFRSSQNMTHYKVCTKIRNTIKELGGILPEDLLTPNKSLKQIEKENK